MIGSLRNPKVPLIASAIRKAGFDAFDDWYAAGPEADDFWRDYEKARGHTFSQALDGHAAKNVFAFDKRHLDSSDAAVLVLPAGKSGHLELGYIIGRGKPAVILLEQDDPERFDVMYQFAGCVTGQIEKAIEYLRQQSV